MTTTIHYGVIQTRGQKETIERGGQKKQSLAGAQGCQGDIWPTLTMHCFTQLKYIKYTPARIHHGTLMINSYGLSVVMNAYAVMHCLVIA